MTGFVSETSPVEWSKDFQKTYNHYVNEERLYALLLSTKQPKAKEFFDIRKQLANKMVEELRYEHQQDVKIAMYENVS